MLGVTFTVALVQPVKAKIITVRIKQLKNLNISTPFANLVR
jgi:hypothetical protein